MKDEIKFVIAWLWTIWQVFVLEAVIRIFSGQWGSMDHIAFCIALIALFETVRIRQKL